MNTLFENKYKCTEEIYKDIYKYIYFHNNLTFGIVIFYIFWIIFSNYISITSGSGIKFKSIIGLILIFGFLVLYSKTAAKRRYQNDLNSNKWIPTITTFMVREDAIVVKHSNSSANPIAYSEFKKAEVTKNFIILTTKEKLALYFKKDSFTKGTSEEFIEFIKGKGLNVK